MQKIFSFILIIFAAGNFMSVNTLSKTPKVSNEITQNKNKKRRGSTKDTKKQISFFEIKNKTSIETNRTAGSQDDEGSFSPAAFENKVEMYLTLKTPNIADMQFYVDTVAPLSVRSAVIEYFVSDTERLILGKMGLKTLRSITLLKDNKRDLKSLHKLDDDNIINSSQDDMVWIGYSKAFENFDATLKKYSISIGKKNGIESLLVANANYTYASGPTSLRIIPTLNIAIDQPTEDAETKLKHGVCLDYILDIATPYVFIPSSIKWNWIIDAPFKFDDITFKWNGGIDWKLDRDIIMSILATIYDSKAGVMPKNVSVNLNMKLNEHFSSDVGATISASSLKSLDTFEPKLYFELNLKF